MFFDISLNLAFGSLNQEISEKRNSMLVSPDQAIRELLDFGYNVFGSKATNAINSTLGYVRNIQIKSVSHPDMSNYIAHPVRLAVKTGRIMVPPNLDLLHLALVHNVYELAGFEETDLRDAGFSSYIQGAVRTLTMDRRREFDAQYLAGYYRKIEDFGREIALIKCLDKLDNILGLELMEDVDLKARYLELAVTFVGPIAYRLSSNFGEYFCEACGYMQQKGGQPAFAISLERGEKDND